MPNTNKKGRRKWLGFRSMLRLGECSVYRTVGTRSKRMHWMDARALRRKDAFRGERPWTETVLLGTRFYIPYVLTSVLLALNRIATPSLGRPNEFLLAECHSYYH
ncbi:hypothetical protein V6N13_005463 [Hibiscus sabdariffa]